MSIVKESSDDVNQPAEVAEVLRSKRSVKDYVALAIATCGVGYLPLAPGTWGSLIAVAAYVLVRIAISRYPTDTLPPVNSFEFVIGQLIVVITVTFVGVWAASHTERVLKTKDPGKVVVDEVAGQLIALLPLPLTRIGPWPVLVVIAFLLFRFFDITKPYPARRLEALHGGWGIMADDLIAGAYAAIIVAVVVATGWLA